MTRNIIAYPIKKCQEVIDVRDGTHDSPKYVKQGYPLVTSKNIKDGKIDFTDINYISEEDYIKINQRSKVDVGDILMPMIGTIGNPVLVNREINFAIKNVALYKFKNSSINNKYFYYLLKSSYVLKQIDNLSRGGTQKFVSLSNIRNFEIPIPPIETQMKIANVLDKAQELIDKRKEQIQKLDKFVQSVFLDMFGDPVKNPKGWEKGKIRDLISDVTYGTSEKADDIKGNYPILRMNNITYKGSWDFTSLKYIELEEKEIERFTVKKGDILFNRTNSKELVGKTAVFKLNKPMAFAGYLIRVRANQKANPDYISAFLNSIYGKTILKGMCKSIIGMANINAKELQSIDNLIPPIELQNKFAEIVEEVERQKELMEKSLAEMENNFKSIMQKAFREELFN